jgi:hypothetical protein
VIGYSYHNNPHFVNYRCESAIQSQIERVAIEAFNDEEGLPIFKEKNIAAVPPLLFLPSVPTTHPSSEEVKWILANVHKGLT